MFGGAAITKDYISSRTHVLERINQLPKPSGIVCMNIVLVHGGRRSAGAVGGGGGEIKDTRLDTTIEIKGLD